jgi:hypothetical protein
MRETLDRLKAQIAEMQRIYGENARDAGYLQTTIPIIRKQIQAEALEPEDIETVLPLFPAWEPSLALSVGDVVAHGGVLYEVVQAHTTQADWEPQNVPALFKSHAPAGTVPDWVQPLGGHDAYNLGDRVMYNGQMWESTINANVWAPGVAGWIVV